MVEGGRNLHQVRLAPLLLTQEMESQWEGRMFRTALPGTDQCSLPAHWLWHWHRRCALLSGPERKLTPALLSEGGCSSKAITVTRV